MIKIINLKLKIKKERNSKFKIKFLTFTLHVFAFCILIFTFINPSFALYRLPDKEPAVPFKMTKEYLPPEQKTYKSEPASPIPQVTEEQSVPNKETDTQNEKNSMGTIFNLGALIILISAAAYLVNAFVKGSKK